MSDDLGSVDRMSLESEVAHLKARCQQLQSLLRSYQEAEGSQKALEAALVEAVKACEPYPRVQYKAIKDPSSPVSLVADASDMHVGEIIEPDEIEGFNKFNWEIAQARMFEYGENLIRWAAVQRRAYPIDELVVLAKGDYISGNIHYDFEVTNEFPGPVQAVNAGELLGEFIARLAAHFDKVRVIGVGADNHGRLTRRPQSKQKAFNNYSFVTHAIAKRVLAQHSNVEFTEAKGMKEVVEIKEHRTLVEHGDTIRQWSGLPFYGIVRSMMRESMKRMGLTDRDFHYYSLAHFHVPYILEGRVLGNGSLSGTSEYDHACGRHAAPCQVSYLMHPKHGFFNWVAWRFSR